MVISSGGYTYGDNSASKVLRNAAGAGTAYGDTDDSKVLTTAMVSGAGSIDLSLYTLISTVVVAADVRHGTPRYTDGSTGLMYGDTDATKVLTTATTAGAGSINLSLYTLSSTINWPTQAQVLHTGTPFYGITGSLLDGTYVQPVQADVKRPADGGTAYGPSSGTSGTLNTTAIATAAAAAQLVTDQNAVTNRAGIILNPASVEALGLGSSTILGVSGTFNGISSNIVMCGLGLGL
jgi:hypothetical protein